MARRLRDDGWDVATTDVEGDVTMAADLGDSAAPAALLDAVGARDALVLCHTYWSGGGLFEVTAAELDRHLAVNVRGTLLLLQEFARRLDGPGRVVLFTSGPPLRGEIAYAASKGAIEGIAMTAAVELGPRGVTVNAIDPGPTGTGWMTPEIERRVGEATPLGRAGRAEDAADVVALLLSPAAARLTGEILRADGGYGLVRTRP